MRWISFRVSFGSLKRPNQLYPFMFSIPVLYLFNSILDILTMQYFTLNCYIDIKKYKIKYGGIHHTDQRSNLVGVADPQDSDFFSLVASCNSLERIVEDHAPWFEGECWRCGRTILLDLCILLVLWVSWFPFVILYSIFSPRSLLFNPCSCMGLEKLNENSSLFFNMVSERVQILV